MVVQDTVTVDGKLEEMTFDWYAQDKQGNVLYSGEDSKEYRNNQGIDVASFRQTAYLPDSFSVDGTSPKTMRTFSYDSHHTVMSIAYTGRAFTRQSELRVRLLTCLAPECILEKELGRICVE